MEEVQKYVKQKVDEAKKQKTAPVVVAGTVSNADELKKYKELLDAGIITQEEFDAKKKQLLGL
jgi:predicted Zn-dependent peptidase